MEQTDTEYRQAMALYRLLEAKALSLLSAGSIRRQTGDSAWYTLLELRSPHVGTATIMALTACRWRELPQIDLPALFAGDVVAWKSVKGGAQRTFTLQHPPSELHSSRLSPSTPPHVVGYPCHAAAVRRAVRRANVEPIGFAHKSTHVWRHLRAWHMILHGCSIEHIQRTLGHRRGDSTDYYTRSMPAHIRELIYSEG